MSFIRELKRRNVFKVGIAYLVASWVLLQIADVMMNMLTVPEFMGRVIILLLALGFPIAIILAWAFDMTPEGLRPDSGLADDATPVRRGRPLFEFLVFATLIVASGYFALDRYRSGSESDEDRTAGDTTLSSDAGDRSAQGTSIAVLPFVNMSSDPEQEYFSDGIAEELLNVLSRVPGLTVASRTSTFAFKGENRNIPEIAAILKVDHVLEGSVRKSGNKVRITVQLIDTQRDRHMWSETYDRELTDIFRIQDEISSAIVESLEDALGVEVPDSMTVAASTTDMNAYDFYLQALSLFSSVQSMSSARRSVDLLEQAVEADPEFAAAWMALAEALVRLPTWFHSLDIEEYLTRAQEAAERVLQLDANLIEARMTLAEIAYLRRDWDVWLEHLETAEHLDPVSARYHDPIIAEGWMGLGYLSKALAITESVSGRNPDDAFQYTIMGLALLSLKRSDEAMPILRQAMINGYAGGLQETTVHNYFGSQKQLAWTVEFAQFLQNHDPDLFPLLPYMEHLVFSGDDDDKERIRQFWIVAKELGYGREELLAPGPVWGLRLRDDVLIALGEFDAIADVHFGNTPLFWLWTPDLHAFRQSDAFRRRIRDTGMLAFWQQHGWPDLCRPAAGDDFVCD
jgi:TolB-like protein